MGPSTRIDALRRRIETDPASIAFAQLAEEYRRSGQLQEAVDTCRAGLVAHPDYLSARVTLGRALLALGRLDQSVHELRQVIAAAPQNLAAHRALAEALRRQGRMREALHHFRAAAALAPGDPDLDRIIIDMSHTDVAASAGSTSMEDSDGATVAALGRWLEAIHAARAERLP